MAACTPELTSLLDDARRIARRAGHRAVSEAHVLLACVGHHGAARAVREDYQLLPERLENALQKELANALLCTYRGDSDPESRTLREGELDALVRRATTTRRAWRAFRPLEVQDLLRAVLAAPRFRPMIDDARIGIDGVRVFARRGRDEAVRRGDRQVLAEHALLAACDGSALREPLDAAGVALHDLRAAWDAVLTRNAASMRLGSEPSLVLRALALGTASGTPDGLVLRVVVFLLRDPRVAAPLRAAGFDAYDLLFAIAHKRMPNSGSNGLSTPASAFPGTR